MFRRNKKIIVISLLALGLLWLLYSLLTSRPEMVVDENLRVSEEVDPEFERIIDMSKGHAVDPVEAPLKTESTSDVMTRHLGSESLVSAMQDSLDVDDEVVVMSSQIGSQDVAEGYTAAGPQGVVVSTEFELESAPSNDIAQSQELVSELPENTTQNISRDNPFINPFKANANQPVNVGAGDSSIAEVNEESQSEGALIESSNSDVALLADQDGFIDLNLTDKKSVDLVLLEGDEIIIDDVNEELVKFEPPVGVASDIKVEQASVSALSDRTLGSTKQAKAMLESELVILPEADEELMAGTDAVSLEYQASYKKLKLVTDKLKAANEKNQALTGQFDELANDNRKLAQIIRDIDDKIKVLVVEN